MPLRAEMAAVISELRRYGQAAPDDEFDGETYWNDLQLQDIADREARRGLYKIKRVDPAYKIYKIVVPQSVRFEDDLTVYDGESLLAASYTLNYQTNEIVFTTAQGVDELSIYGLGIQIYDALADLWQIKADQRFNYIDWKAQNNKMNMKQEYDHCLQQSAYYRSKRIRTFDRKGRGRWHDV